MTLTRNVLGLALLVVAACGSSSSDSGSDQPGTNDPGESGGTTPPSSPGNPNNTTPGGDGEDPTAMAPRFVDTCKLQGSACTTAPAGFAEGSGLAPVDRCAFALEESADLAAGAGAAGASSPLITALETITKKVAPADVFADGNRVATKTTSVPGSPASIGYAFKWQDDDNKSTKWTPQGLTGTADADATGKVGGKSGVLVSFYNDPPAGEVNDGVRIAFVDTTTPTAPKYRFALLVIPKGTAAAPSFDPVKIHAGGIVWFGDFLYVADTTHGFRVFDMRHILQVATDVDTFGCTVAACHASAYKYVIPQIGKYEISSACSPLFSYVSLDRKSDPPALVSGEYCSTDACAGALAGRVYRWPLDAKTGLLRSKTTFPVESFLTSHKQVQGGAYVDGTFYLSSSAPAAAGGELYRVAGAKSATSNWSDSPEDLMVDAPNGWLWSLSEAAGSRAVYGAKLTSYPKPN